MLRLENQASNVIQLQEWEEIVGIIERIKVKEDIVNFQLFVPAWGKSVLLPLKLSEIVNEIPLRSYRGYSIGIIRTDLTPQAYRFRIIGKSQLFRLMQIGGNEDVQKEIEAQDRRPARQEIQPQTQTVPPGTTESSLLRS